jgi:hypothetical protein
MHTNVNIYTNDSDFIINLKLSYICGNISHIIDRIKNTYGMFALLNNDVSNIGIKYKDTLNTIYYIQIWNRITEIPYIVEKANMIFGQLIKRHENNDTDVDKRILFLINKCDIINIVIDKNIDDKLEKLYYEDNICANNSLQAKYPTMNIPHIKIDSTQTQISDADTLTPIMRYREIVVLSKEKEIKSLPLHYKK